MVEVAKYQRRPIFGVGCTGWITPGASFRQMLRSFHTLVLGLFVGIVTAQELPQVDITLVQTDADRYEVRVRPDGPFNGLFHSYLFTLRWSASATATGLDLDPTVPMEDISLYPALSGTIVSSGGYKYAPYTAETIVTLSSVGQSWVGGEEITIASVQVLGGTADLQLANDVWTHTNNGDFYLSLNGYERQGVIYSIGTGLSSLMENTSDVRCTMDGDMLHMNFSMDQLRDMEFEVVDMRGGRVANGGFVVPSGRSTNTVNVGQLAAGSYAVHMRSPGWERSVRVAIVR